MHQILHTKYLYQISFQIEYINIVHINFLRSSTYTLYGTRCIVFKRKIMCITRVSVDGVWWLMAVVCIVYMHLIGFFVHKCCECMYWMWIIYSLYGPFFFSSPNQIIIISQHTHTYMVWIHPFKMLICCKSFWNASNWYPNWNAIHTLCANGIGKCNKKTMDLDF